MSDAHAVEDMVRFVTGLLRSYRFGAATEADLQAQIAQVFDRTGLAYQREVVLSADSRIDFLLPADGIGLEVKIAGSASAVLRQLFRYAECDQVATLVLITRRAQLARLTGPLLGKALHVVHVTGGLS